MQVTENAPRKLTGANPVEEAVREVHVPLAQEMSPGEALRDATLFDQPRPEQ